MSNTGAKAVMVGLPLIAIAGVATFHFALRGSGGAATAVPEAAPGPAVEPPQGPTKFDVVLEADVPGATVTFRRKTVPAPYKAELAPSDYVELVDVGAAGYRTQRFWIGFDRATHLQAHLVRGDGIDEPNEEQTLVALGEAQAPAVVPAAVVASRPAVVAVRPRKIGHGGGDGATGTATGTETVTATGTVTATDTATDTATATATATATDTATATAAGAGTATATATGTAAAAGTATATRSISPASLRSLLASGPSIDLPAVVLTQMAHDEKTRLAAVIKVCIDPSGAVATASVIKSSGYAAYDEHLVAGIRAWKYRPYVDNGRPQAACSAVAVSYARP